MPRTYTELNITADPSLTEELVGMMAQLGFEGFWEDGTSLKCYMSGTRWTPGMLAEVEAAIRLLTRSSTSVSPYVTVRTIQEVNWNALWERSIRPVHITERIVVAPTWNPYEGSTREIVITINPKMSFGTGYHESTRIAVRLVEKYVQPGMHILDVGTGTGILAIAAVKLGARSALGLDIDDWAYNNAVENVELNGVSGTVMIAQKEIGSLPLERFAMVVANIQRTVIEELLPSISMRLEPSGVLILSGLLTWDRDPIGQSLRSSGFTVLHEEDENEWIGIAARGR